MTLVFGKPTGGSGASDFTSLSDTPSSYSGQGGKATRVNAGESAVEFYTPTDANDAVKVSSNDTTAGFLNGKLLGGTNVTLVEGTDGGNETLTIDASVDISGKQNILAEGAFVDGDKTKLDTYSEANQTTNNAKVSYTDASAVAANTAKVTNATHTGDVTGDGVLTIAAGAVDIPMLSATGTADGTTFLSGDGTWKAAGGNIMPTLTSLSGTIDTEETKDIILTGVNFDTGISFTWGAGLTINSTTRDSDTQVTFNITAGATAQDVTCTLANQGGYIAFTGNKALDLTIDQGIVVLIPGDGTTNWERLTGATGGLGTLTSTSATAWAVGGSFLIGTGDFELEYRRPLLGVMIGVDSSDPDRNYTTMDYGIYAPSTGTIYVYENGVNKYSSGSAGSNPLFKITKTGTTIKYYKDGALFYTSLIAASASMVFDSSFAGSGLSVTDISVTKL